MLDQMKSADMPRQKKEEIDSQECERKERMKEEITDNNPSVEECKIAIKSIWGELSNEQKEILIYTYKNRGVSVAELADHMGHENKLGFWGIYGRMARKIYNCLEKDYGYGEYIVTLLWTVGPNSGASYEMFLRPQFAKALEELNLVENEKGFRVGLSRRKGE